MTNRREVTLHRICSLVSYAILIETCRERSGCRREITNCPRVSMVGHHKRGTTHILLGGRRPDPKCQRHLHRPYYSHPARSNAGRYDSPSAANTSISLAHSPPTLTPPRPSPSNNPRSQKVHPRLFATSLKSR